MSIDAKAQTIALYVDPNRGNAQALAERVSRAFSERGYDVLSTEGKMPFGEAALLVTIGGDGTLLRAARLAIESDTPLLGINTGRLGFLTEFDEDDPRIERLPELFANGLHIEERVALQAEYNGKHYFALNDVIVRKGGISRIVPFGLCLDDDQAAHIPADGICISTPTGSTAYFLSAGGAIISPRVEAFGIAPLLAHTLFSRPLIVPITSRITITCDSEIEHANLETDGDLASDLKPGASVVITKHPKTIRFARTSPLHFFERLEEKMLWGVSIKRI
ncbi:MAG: NAD(+)/NADH kinase [Candidatus Eremiobacteraeota bacterium]|nr:NAD(+)/NADH kinase [Candidatus Eremiobacteraeota bacterium]MBV9736558.1 NAD(+)/NADH kinase [Candidatus Eremiobacteraeota bacterium]